MKLTVVIGRDGKIVGTAHSGGRVSPQAGEGGPVAGPGQTLQVIEAPYEPAELTGVDDLHRRIEHHMGARPRS